jgi:hypothetical protein
MPLGSAAMTLAEIEKQAIAAERIGWGLIGNSRWNIALERCVLIKLSLRLLHCRKIVDRR